MWIVDNVTSLLGVSWFFFSEREIYNRKTFKKNIDEPKTKSVYEKMKVDQCFRISLEHFYSNTKLSFPEMSGTKGQMIVCGLKPWAVLRAENMKNDIL